MPYITYYNSSTSSNNILYSYDSYSMYQHPMFKNSIGNYDNSKKKGMQEAIDYYDKHYPDGPKVKIRDEAYSRNGQKLDDCFALVKVSDHRDLSEWWPHIDAYRDLHSKNCF